MIRQHLRIKRFYGLSENAVKRQLWIAIATCVPVAGASTERTATMLLLRLYADSNMQKEGKPCHIRRYARRWLIDGALPPYMRASFAISHPMSSARDPTGPQTSWAISMLEKASGHCQPTAFGNASG